MKMGEMRMGKAIRRTSLLSALPEDAFTSGTRVTLICRGAVLIEGQRGVVELSETRIRLKTLHGVLSIEGKALTLQELSVDAAMIRSECIESASYA